MPSPSDKNKKWLEEADAWYFNLETMAKKIESNEERAKHLRRRQWVAITFFFAAFMLLAYRTELQQHRSAVNSGRISLNNEKISRNTDLIREQQAKDCLGGLIILTKFNNLQDELSEVERSNKFVDASIRQRRIAAYQRAKVLPLPVCYR